MFNKPRLLDQVRLRQLKLSRSPHCCFLVLAESQGDYRLVVSLLCDSGLRLLEALRLREKNVGVESMRILVRDGKGAKNRITMLPE